MSVKINLGAWRSVFAVPSQVVDEGLKFSDGVKLKVLLCLLRNADGELDEQKIYEITGVNVTDIPEALEYWVSMGILQKDGDVFFPVEQDEQQPLVEEPKKKEESKAATEKPKTGDEISAEVEESKKHFTVTKPQKPDYVFTTQRLAVDDELRFIVNEAQISLGKTLSNSDIATLLMLKDTCGLPVGVLMMLIQYAISIDKGNMRTIEKIGVSWADDGILSVEAAENKIRLSRQNSNQYSIVSQAFGLKNVGSPTKKQLEYCAKWIGEWKFSSDMLREAYERCVDSKGVMKFNYIDGILKRWQANGIKNLADLKEFESKKDSSGSDDTESSYDISELDKFDTLDFIK